MPVLIRFKAVVGTVTNDYQPKDNEALLPEPENFDLLRMADYRLSADGLSLQLGGIPVRAITYWAFRKRFTHAERVGMELAALDNPIAPGEQRQQAAAVRVYLADAAAAQWIDLDSADARAGVQGLESFGLLGAGRAAEILDAPLTNEERPV